MAACGRYSGWKTVWILDGTPSDWTHAGYLDRLASKLPHDVTTVAWREIDEAMAELAAELSRRSEAHDTKAPALFLVIYGLQRFRMLRRREADFSFSLSDDEKPPSPDKHFANLLREGPAYGIHTLAWCDTLTNLERTIERQGVSEFDNRVLFQMGVSESTSLIDSAQAAKLGLRRALFFNEEHGTLEKFRPYAVPPEAWLAEVAEKLSRKAKAKDPDLTVETTPRRPSSRPQERAG